MWIIIAIILATITVVTLLINLKKDDKIEALQYEVGYLALCLLHEDKPKRHLTDEELLEIKRELDKRIK
ncbi:DUF1514 family protein [Staphylococcus gallinarum]|uniref:DUF1514 family protein n=1 Tax=Staphylococcus gallinarum TaxID=1293 RepID=UPI00227FA062|nr:DUF1514 family protein [Staphylococcus gallinarum]MDN6414811.1 DUF1514 family protein [Staphylococcus gallinarum]